MALQDCALNLDRTRRELQAHGTAAFPCAGYLTRCTARVEDEIAWHYHPEFEFIYLYSGALRVRVPGEEMLLRAGEGCWVNAGVLHFAVAETVCELHSLVYAPALLGDEDSVFARRYTGPLSALPGHRLRRFAPDVPAEAALLRRGSDAFDALRADVFGYEFAVRDSLSAVTLFLCREYADELANGGAAVPVDTVRTRLMLEYIHAHAAEAPTLEDIAAAADICPREALRCFRRSLNIAPVQYALKYRITQSAAALLTQPHRSVAQVAADFGFDSAGYYAQLFRRYFICTPREYRARQEKQTEKSVR